MKRIRKIESLLGQLADLEDPHLQLVLLGSCAGFPRFNFALRTSLPNRITQAIVAFDQAVDKCMVVIWGRSFSKE
jgi:hypothetical protein